MFKIIYLLLLQVMIINDLTQIFALIMVVTIISILLSSNGTQSIIEIPVDIKCVFNEELCEQNDVTVFTILISLIYFILGYVYPNKFAIAIFSSFGYQIVRHATGHGSSYLIDPLANITAYL